MRNRSKSAPSVAMDKGQHAQQQQQNGKGHYTNQRQSPEARPG
jgi:hypothetical protein